MSDWKLGTRIFLLVAVMIGVGLLLPQQAESYENGGGVGEYDFVFTAAAAARTAAWECGDPNGPNNPKCLEMCFVGRDGDVVPQGEFECFYG